MNKNNTGEENTRDRNSGDWNSGNWNSGDWNSGEENTGDWNSGDRNSGDWNSGDWNSGDWNSGDWNSGDWNSGDWNSGFFNTDSPDKIQIFNTWLDMTHEEFNKKYNTYMDIPLNRWVYEDDMTDKEKEDVNGWSEMEGYLKTLPFKEACQIWWKENPKEHNRFLELPNFNAELFKEITGIDVEVKTSLSDDELIAELEKRGKIKQGKIVG